MACGPLTIKDKKLVQMSVVTAVRDFLKNKDIELFINTILDKTNRNNAYTFNSYNELNIIEEAITETIEKNPRLKDDKEEIKNRLSSILYKRMNLNPPSGDTPLDPTIEQGKLEEDDNIKVVNVSIDNFYGKAIKAKEAMVELFKTRILEHCLINFKTGKRIVTDSDLNGEIREFKKELFSKILDYLEVPNSERQELYTNSHLNESFYLKTLSSAFKKLSEIDTELIDEAFNNINKGTNRILINAFHAYAILSNFDALITKNYGKIFKILEDGSYSRSISNNLTKNWRTSEDVDAMKELGQYSRLLIETCPLITSTGKQRGFVRMESFLGVMNKLRDESLFKRVMENPRLYKMMTKFHSAPNYYLPKILQSILNKEFESYVTFSRSDLDVIRSVYNRFYKRKELPEENYSLYDIITAEYENSTTVNTFDILECIAGVVDRCCGNYYTQYIPNDDGIVVANDVRRLNENKEMFRKQKSINKFNFNRTDIGQLKEKYKFLNEKDKISVTINGIKCTYNYTAKSWIISNSFKLDDYNDTFIKLIDYYINNKAVGFTDKEKNFIKLIEFIDDILDTNFINNNMIVLNRYVENRLDYLNSKKISPHLCLDNLLTTAITALNANIINDECPKDKDIIDFVNENNYGYFVNIFKKSSSNKGYIENGKILPINSQNNQHLIDLVLTEQELLGSPYKTTSKNVNNDNIPMNGISNLASNFISYVIETTNGSEGAFSGNLFSGDNIKALGEVNIKMDAKNRNGIKKAVSNFSVAELSYTSIIYDYLSPRFSKTNRKVKIQPTTYSDKSRIYVFNVLIDSLKDSEGKSFSELYKDEGNKYTNVKLKKFKRDVSKTFYKKIYDRVIEDYRKVYTHEINKNKVEEILSRLEDKTRKELTEKFEKPELLNSGDFTKLLSVTGYWEYADMSWNAGVDNVENVHVTKNGEYLTPNNSLFYKATVLYDNDEVFEKRCNEEIKKFATDLFNSNTRFWTKFSDGSNNTVLSKIIRDFGLTSEWINNNTEELIIAKDNEGNIITRSNYKEKLDENFELNPLLELYFYEYSTIAENLRLLLTGAETAHPFKSKSSYDISPSNFDAFQKEESARAKAQLKRNVIVPATLNYFMQESFLGIPSEYRIAVMSDFPAEVYNFQGDKSSIDSMDGSALVHPVISILENLSLQDYSVGSNKKPIGHALHSDYGNADLLKFATFGIDNEWIRRSNLSDISLKKLVKKMSFSWSDKDIDLTKNIYGKDMPLSSLLEGNRIFYRNKNRHYEVLDLVRTGRNTYNVKYQEVNNSGNVILDEEGNPKVFEQTKVIDNLTALWEALGAEYSETLDQYGLLEYSNASWEVVARYVNWVGEFKGEKGEKPTQRNTIQPLKDTMIAYLCNKSAIKVGARNINRKESWIDDNELRYFIMPTKGMGIQMDPDHHADEAEMTEFTQVISSLEANGWLHDVSKLSYQDLGKATLSIISDKNKAVEKYLKEHDKSDMYDIIGRELVKGIRENDNTVGLSKSIIEIIRKEFKKQNKNHNNDEYKIPFSDSNIQSISLSTLTSKLNNTAVKKKHPGSGMVMVPGFGTIQNFWINGEKYSYDDIYALAAEKDMTPEEYLESIQSQIESSEPTSIDKLMVSDRIKVRNKDGELISININTIEKYNEIKSTYTEFYYDVTKGQDLKPVQIKWTVNNKQYNLFDTPAVKEAIMKRSSKEIELTEDDNLNLQKNIQTTLNLLYKGFMWVKPVSEGNPTPEEINKYGELTDINGIWCAKIEGLDIKPAELVISKLYASKFNLTSRDSISKIKLQGIKFFLNRYNTVHKSKITNYDLAFTRGTGKHVYIFYESPKSKKQWVEIEDSENILNIDGVIWRTDSKGNKLYKLKENEKVLAREYLLNGETVLVTNDSDVINQIYKSDDFDTVKISTPGEIVDNFLSKYKGKNKYLESLIGESAEKVKEINEDIAFKLARKQYVSFLKSLEFTASRIPAQSLQSFMKMEVSQFLSTDKNVAIVTPFQAWLQGSDYPLNFNL